MGPTLVFAQANTKSVVDNSKPILYVEDPSKIIDYVENDKGIISIGDFVYRLKLNTKIYDAQKKLVNRYALREGQRVLIEVSDDASENNIDSIYILGK
jgi:hypothetical protein